MKVINVIRTINRGGFGIIEMVLCDDQKLYARKTFSPSPNFNFTQDLLDKFKLRFAREVRVQKSLPQDSFMPIHYEELECDNPWFLMPVAEKVYTEEITQSKKEGRIPKGLADILNAMEIMHAAGFVHRDLKPHNILLHDGKWKLSDFGLISQTKEIVSQSITSTGDNLRTEMYCSPEQLTNFKRVTHKADIYSFGAILHDIFSDDGRIPYSELSAKGEIGLIIQKCTKKNPDHRFSNITILRDRLLSIISDVNHIALTPDEEGIATFMKSIESWKIEELEKFLYNLKRIDYKKSNIFIEFREEVLSKFFEIDSSISDELYLMYCEWLNSRSFNFDYCDVIINRLEFIYLNSNDIEVKSSVALAAAHLGAYHNRWYVMHRVIKMCNPNIPEPLAFRISLEMDMNPNLINEFIICATVKGTPSAVYHPLIAQAISKN